MSNVHALPTAAPRKVQGNTRTRAKRAAAELLPRFPKDRYIEPRIRSALDEARHIRNDEGAFEALAWAMFHALDDTTKRRVEIRLIAGCDRQGPRAALAHIRFQAAPSWRQWDIQRALAMLDSGEVE